jgi:undecaprenyl phosphate N,N'-diacetylbacillosamine 1-phosphate transferase
MTVQTVLGHTDEVAEDTNAVEGNFAEIRKKRLEETGSLEKPAASEK